MRIEREPARRAHVAAMAVLLAVAIAPVWGEMAWNPPEALETSSRARISIEALNRRALWQGDVPLWNAHQFAGGPHLANAETLVFYPPHLVLRFLPPHLLFPVSFALHAWLAALGVYLVARRLALPPAASGFVAVAVILSGSPLPGREMGYSGTFYGVAWIPLIVFLTEKSLARRTWLPHPALVAVTAFAIAGSPRDAPYALAAVFAGCVLARLLHTRRGLVSRTVLPQAAALLVFVTGLTAYQTLPMMRFWLNAEAYGGVARAAVSTSAVRARKPVKPDERLKSLLAPIASGRVVSTCDRALDASDMVALGLNGIAGGGGLVLADYARFLHLVRGGDPRRWSPSVIADGAALVGVRTDLPDDVRTDLLPFLNVEYLVSCEARDSSRWIEVGRAGDAIVYRSVRKFPRAFWTCMPAPVGRAELQYRLWRSIYDDRTVLSSQGLSTADGTGASIAIRWAPGVDDEVRVRLEAELRIHPQRFRGDRTWQYELSDSSQSVLRTIVNHPMVEDTADLDRSTLALTQQDAPRDFDRPVPVSEPASEWIIGSTSCSEIEPASVLQADGLDGRTVVAVDAPRDGLVFLSEPYYPGRAVWVDGARVEPLKVNLAFTGVPVTSGVHRIELQYDPLAFPVGAGMSVMTATAWAAFAYRRRATATTEPVRTADAHSA